MTQSPPPSRRPKGDAEGLLVEQPDIPALVLNDLIEEYKQDQPRRDAERKILWRGGKEKRK